MNSPSALEEDREFLRLHEATNSFDGFCRYIAPDEPPDAAHHQLFCSIVDDIVAGHKRRVMVFVPPGSAKSTYFSVRAPAYIVGKQSDRGLIAASYSDKLSQSFGRKVRNIVDSQPYRRIFPKTSLQQDSKAKGEWETANGGFYFAAGIGGGVTGRRGDGLVGDDIIRGRKDADSETVRNATWDSWEDDFMSRLKPYGWVMLIMTRWHEDDPAGRILPDDWDGESGWVRCKDGEDWYVICLPAKAEQGDLLGRQPGEWLWPEWCPPEEWERIEERMKRRPRSWRSLYQQRPTPDDGDFFRREWFKRYTDRPRTLGVYMAGDFAFTDDGGDYTELAVWGIDDDYIYALDWWTGQKNNLAAAKQWIKMVKRWRPRVFVGEKPNEKAWAPLLRQQMRKEKCFTRLEWVTAPPRESQTVSGKQVAARGWQALLENGVVLFPMMDWAEDVIDQHVKFPATKHDDKVDTCSMIARFVDKTWPKHEPPKPKKPELIIKPPTFADLEPDDDFRLRA